MQKFRGNELKVLIATDVSARGVDIPNVEYVINYDMPETSENYVHRVGRTGRGNQKGQAISFCSDEEKVVLSEIENNLGKTIQVLEISKENYSFTIETTGDNPYDWKKLLKEASEDEENYKKKKRKKKSKSKK